MHSFSSSTLNRLLLISGTGRNTGKTTFACSIINDLPKNNKPIGIKISIHFHPQASFECLHASKNFNIYEEKDSQSLKDTGRMLNAGAKKVFFIESEELFLPEAFAQVLTYIPDNEPIVCESGGLRRYLKPALFFVIHKNNMPIKPSATDLIQLADHYFSFKEGKLNIPKNVVTFENHCWKLNL